MRGRPCFRPDESLALRPRTPDPCVVSRALIPKFSAMATPFEVQSLGTALGAAKEYADSVVKGPLSQIGGILTDTVGYWRLKNQVRLILKAKVWLEERGVEPTKLLPDIL